MDVKCERCNTEYEFDDALVSGRGTTVKCTNCGHKFKIRRGDGDFSEDFWNVTTGDGRTLVFTSLRELQRAIQGYLVERNDRLSRGGLPPKAIGQIPELAPFFEQREAAKRSQTSKSTKTQDGLGPAAAAMVAATQAEAAPPPTPRQKTTPEFPAPPPQGSNAGKATLIGTGPLSSEPAIPVKRVSVPPPVPRQPMNTQPITRPTPTPPPAPAPVRTIASGSSLVPQHQASVPPPVPRRESTAPITPPMRLPPPPAPMAETPLPPPRVRSLLAEIEEDRDRHASAHSEDEPLRRRRRSVGGFVVTGVVLVCAALLGVVWIQKNGASIGGRPPPPPVATVDPRVATFLANGEKAMAEGNLEVAKESFDKASALADKDPKVLLGVARLAAARADVFWLKARLLPADAADEQRFTRDSLGDLAAGARRAADDALAVAPDDQAALRAKIDALRISGDRDGGRALVPKISASSGQPETAYVLAALDLAEAEPLWSTVVDRLKLAAGAESGPGRGRAALVYALVRAGDLVTAKGEVDRLTAMPKAHPLLPLLRSLVDHAKPKAKSDAGVDAAVSAVDTSIDAGKGHPAPAGGGAVPSDARDLVAQGEKARAKGDYAKAKTMFTAASEKNPNDSEALAGLAAIAYAQHDLPGARTAYKRVLAINPNYMPAVVGLADVEWDSGDHATAQKMYKDIVDRYPEGAYPARVKQRSEG